VTTLRDRAGSRLTERETDARSLNGLIVDTAVAAADVYAVVDAAVTNARRVLAGRPLTVGGGKATTRRVVDVCRAMRIAPRPSL
jgi:hypothetical protein